MINFTDEEITNLFETGIVSELMSLKTDIKELNRFRKKAKKLIANIDVEVRRDILSEVLRKRMEQEEIWLIDLIEQTKIK